MKFEQMRVYIAAPFFTPEQLEIVQDTEDLLTSMEIDFFSPRSFGVIKNMNEEEKAARMKQIYDQNIEELEKCNVYIFHVDYPDTGTSFEIGYAACKTANIYKDEITKDHFLITLSTLGKPVNVMLRYCIDAHCINHEGLEEVLRKINDGQTQFTLKADVNE
jgi:nucleoside 2-deoxyribosyltransferase